MMTHSHAGLRYALAAFPEILCHCRTAQPSTSRPSFWQKVARDRCRRLIPLRLFPRGKGNGLDLCCEETARRGRPLHDGIELSVYGNLFPSLQRGLAVHLAFGQPTWHYTGCPRRSPLGKPYCHAPGRSRVAVQPSCAIPPALFRRMHPTLRLSHVFPTLDCEC